MLGLLTWVRQFDSSQHVQKNTEALLGGRMKTLYGHFIIWSPATHSIAQPGLRLVVATQAKAELNQLIF